MTEFEERVVDALDRIAAALEAPAAGKRIEVRLAHIERAVRRGVANGTKRKVGGR